MCPAEVFVKTSVSELVPAVPLKFAVALTGNPLIEPDWEKKKLSALAAVVATKLNNTTEQNLKRFLLSRPVENILRLLSKEEPGLRELSDSSGTNDGNKTGRTFLIRLNVGY